MKNRESMIKF